MAPILPEDVDYNNLALDRRSGHRRQEDIEMFSSFSTGGMPPWAQTMSAVAKAIAFVGVPSVIALFLVYQNASWLPKIQASQLETQQQEAQIRGLIDQLTIKEDQTHRLLQRICSNTAKTVEDRQRCFDN